MIVHFLDTETCTKTNKINIFKKSSGMLIVKLQYVVESYFQRAVVL